MSADIRRAREAQGRLAEGIAAWRLRLAGWRILAARYRTPVGEIDIVARRGRTLAIVEVKARPALAASLAAVTPAQQARIARAAAHFLARRPDLAGLSVRFDLIAVQPWRVPRHLPDAWRL